ncbi:MAG: hypothetical protein ACRCU5_03820 [Rhizobiaceae bacterium]
MLHDKYPQQKPCRWQGKQQAQPIIIGSQQSHHDAQDQESRDGVQHLYRAAFNIRTAETHAMSMNTARHSLQINFGHSQFREMLVHVCLQSSKAYQAVPAPPLAGHFEKPSSKNALNAKGSLKTR